jgi:ribosomal protein S18 acetylase RimI-like enzyme
VLNVRRAARADLEPLVTGNLNMAEETEGLKLNLDTLRAGVLAVLEQKVPGAFWIAELDGRVVGQMMITYEWSDWRNGMIWWIQSVHVDAALRQQGIFRKLYAAARAQALAAGARGLRLYVDTTNTRAQAVYRSLGMNGDHYRVFEDMF